jgi:hypothetical protein
MCEGKPVVCEGEKAKRVPIPLWGKVAIGILIVVIVAMFGYMFYSFNGAAHDLSINRGHTNIVYAYLPSGNEAILSLESVCEEPFHSVVGGQVFFRDFSAPIIYVVGGGCADNEIIQTIVYQNATTTVHIIDLDQALKPNTTVSG